jgi:hypothetical protein
VPKLKFCNVDLEMVFAKEPKVLLRELGRKVMVLYSGAHPKGHFVALEVSLLTKDAHQTMRRWLKLLGALSPAARREFEKASSRVFDLGFEVSTEQQPVQIELPKEQLAELAKLGASYVVTLYAAEEELPVVKIRKRSHS